MNNRDLKLLQQKAALLRSEGKYKEAIEFCYHLLKRGIEDSDYKSILSAYINIAASYYCLGDIEEAFNNLDLYNEVCSKHGDDKDKLNLYNTLFLLYEYNKDFYKAKRILAKSIKLGKKLKIYNMLSNAYSNYSHILINESNYTEALKMSKIGLKVAKLHRPKSAILEVRVKFNIAASYIGLKNIKDSGLIINEIINDPILDSFIREKAQCYMVQGEWYNSQGLYNKAFESLTYAKKIVESYSDLYLLKEIQERRCKLCKLMGDISLGYEVQSEYIELLKKINKKELDTVALKLDIKYNIAEMEKKSNIDYLSGLYNRSYLETTANYWLAEAATEKENIACIVFDIDNFKCINDNYGHLFGDEVIKQIGKSCSGLIRKGDLIGRYGGDEFVVILRNSSLEDGMEIAERIKAKLESLRIKKDKKSIFIKTSIGIADNSRGSVLSFEDLFHMADTRLYKAKQNGKSQICVL